MTDNTPNDPDARHSDEGGHDSLESAPTDQRLDELGTSSWPMSDDLSESRSAFSDVKPVDPSDSDPGTIAPPSFPAPAPKTKKTAPKPGAEALPEGSTIDDFEIVNVLGRGAFAVVYLARQLSLDRLVALKVAANIGSEGRTMARLEHQHIVQVFSESVDQPSNQRLLCMQLVPGTSLQAVIMAVHRRGDDRPGWNGKDLLAILHESANLPEVLDPSALHDREALAEMDDAEATAWIGARLGEALDFAHHQGVLHRDIKPANILVNQYGRPMLADFNISQIGEGDEAEGQFGGTIPYMAPEHLDAFNPSVAVSSEAVDEQSDIYSLGIVLCELLHGKRPFPLGKLPTDMVSKLKHIAEQRRETKPSCGIGPPNSRKVVEQTIGQCLEAEPEDRFSDGKQLADALDGCRRLRQAERELPEPNAITRAAIADPFRWFLIFAMLPHLAGSIVNIVYNKLQIISNLTEQQETLFWQLVTGYNAIVYPVLIFIFWRAIRPVWSTWQEMCGSEPVASERVDDARRRLIQLPVWAAGLAVVGWFPGGILFPAVIDAVHGVESWTVYAHFLVSFTLSGLIAIAYSYGGVHYVVLRVLYPQMWRDATNFQARSREELHQMPSRHWWISVLAVSIPLFAAIGCNLFDSDVRYKALVVILILLGIAGNEITRATTRLLSQTLVALTGKE